MDRLLNLFRILWYIVPLLCKKLWLFEKFFSTTFKVTLFFAHRSVVCIFLTSENDFSDSSEIIPKNPVVHRIRYPIPCNRHNASRQIVRGDQFFLFIKQSGAAVTRPHGNHQDVGSNPAAARNKKTDIGQTPAQKVPQCDV